MTRTGSQTWARVYNRDRCRGERVARTRAGRRPASVFVVRESQSAAEAVAHQTLRAVEGEPFDTPALEDPRCAPELRRVWQLLGSAVDHAAGQVTFQRLVEEGDEKEQMWYI